MLRLGFAILAIVLWVTTAQAQSAVDALGDPLPPGAVARLGTARLKHFYPPSVTNTNLPPHASVTTLTFAPDGKRFASGTGPGGMVRLWDTATGKAIPGAWDERAIDCERPMAFSPDGALFAVHGQDRTNPNRDTMDLMVCEVSSGKLLRSWTEDRDVRALAFADGGKTLIAACDDAVRWWTVATGKEQRSWKPPEATVKPAQKDGAQGIPEYYFTLFADGRRLVATLWRRIVGNKILPGGETALFDLAAGKELWRVHDAKAGEPRVVLSADNSRVGLLYRERRLDVHDTASGKKLYTLPVEQLLAPRDEIGALALSAGEDRVAVAGPDDRVSVWCARDRKWRTCATPRTNPWPGTASAVAFSPDGTRLVHARGGDLQVLDAATLEDIHAFDGHRDWVDYLAFSADGKRLLTGSAVAVTYPHVVLSWDTATWKQVGLPSDHEAAWPNFGIASAERTVYLGKDGDDRFNLYDYATGKKLGRLQTPARTKTDGSGFFAPGGRVFVAFGGDLYAIPSGKLLCRLPWFFLPGHESIRPVAISADGRLVAVCDWGAAIHVLETATGKAVGRFDPVREQVESEAPVVANLAFSPDDKHLVAWTTRNHAIQVWDLRTGAKRLTLPEAVPARRGIRALHFAWSPDGRVLAVGDGKVINVWELATQKLRSVLRGHQAEVRSLAFSPDGCLLASGSVDTTVLIWDMSGRVQAAARQRRALP
jgi:WD40 repeat protein